MPMLDLGEAMRYVARQPIFNAKRELHAYELLFRDSLENCCPAGDPDLASKRTLDTVFLFGVSALADGHLVYLNCTHDVIVEGFPSLFPAELTVVEVLESANPTPELINACTKLRLAGYKIALDDFVPRPEYEPLIAVADVIKVDFRATPIDDRKKIAVAYGRNGRVLLAEKVETEDEFHLAESLGYRLFQGYFFARPSVLTTAAIDSLNANQTRLLKILSKPQLDFVEAEGVIKSDPALCYRLLRFLNSPAFYFQKEVCSVLNALTLIGEDEARKWLLLASAVLSLRTKNPHLLTMVLVRARFAELLGPAVRLPGSSLFILGLLSLMHAILNIPISHIADRVAVSSDIRAALKGEPNRLGRCLELVTSFEEADWNRCDRLRADLHVSANDLSQCYLQSVEWAKQVSE